MKVINAKNISETVAELCVKANIDLRKDVVAALKNAILRDYPGRSKRLTEAVLENAMISKRERLAVCQDTGMAVVFVELGQDVHIKGDLNAAINKGVETGYKKAHLRNSIVRDPILRSSAVYSPAVIHIDIVKGNKIKLSVLPKGFGCENKSQLKMFKPTSKLSDVKKFIIDTVVEAGPDACPPYVVGVGIGGTADYAMVLAKKALLRPIGVGSYKQEARILEAELIREVNQANIGTMGLGGKTTVLGVNVETYPTHIAGLPVAVNISCHALRSASKTL